MRPLLVTGCQRSGTTAFAEYMNDHEAVLLTRERYKYISPKDIAPEMFSFGRILQSEEGETNAPARYHSDLLLRKEPSRLKWLGDKNPGYVRSLPILSANIPDARFILLYRSVEEVAESFDAKANNPRDHWPEKNNFEAAIKVWNKAQQNTRRFIESHSDVAVLVIDYQDFFGDAVVSVPLLASFLELEFGPPVLHAWEQRSKAFREKRREKAAPTRTRRWRLKRAKDHETDRWIRAYMEHQRRVLA